MKREIYSMPILSSLVLIASIGLISCGNGSTESKHNTANPELSFGNQESAGAIELTSAQIKAVGIQIGNIEHKNLNSVIKASGQLVVPPQNKADVNVLVGGIIKQIYVMEGQAVSKGQVLVSLENTEFIKMQQEYLTTKNSFVFTQAEYQRQKELSAANAGTGKNLQQIEANYNAEKSKIITLEKQLQQLGINPASVANGNIISQVVIVAPIRGTIGHIAVNTGTYAEPGKPLMQIIDNSQIHCDLIVYEKDLFMVKIGQKVNFILTNQNNQEIQGEIYGVNKSFEDESKGIIVHAVIKNAAKYRLIQGMYVTALIDVGKQQVSAVPVDAVVRSEGRDYIFSARPEHAETDSVKNGEAKEKEVSIQFKKVEVITGVSELGFIEIKPIDKLPENSKIVTKGAFYILSKSKGGAEEE
jgi:cobalt-zinc-cadmium efflux system membrane fusion protein